MGNIIALPRLDSLAGKLNLAIVGLFIAVFGSGSLWLSHSLSARLEESGIENLTATNQRVIQMVDAYASALEQSAAMLGNSFAQQVSDATPGTATSGKQQNQLVEAFTRSTKGVATIFVREGDDFVRSATTLQDGEGRRATGTKLDRQHPGFAAVSAGQSYTGRASLFGRDYMTHYAPLKDASGQITGIAFIGVDFTENLAGLKKQIRDIRIGDTGYVFILDAGAQPGTVVVHPSAEGRNLLDSKGGDGRPFIREMLSEKTGLMRYSSTDSAHQETAARDKLAAFASFPRWNWLVATSSFRDEFTRDARFVSIALGVSCLLITALLAACITVLIQRWLAQPLQEAVSVFQRMARGDLSVAIKARGKDEIGQMMQACGQMCDALRNMVQKIQHSMQTITRESEQLMQTADNVAIGSQEQSDGAAALASSIEELSVGIEQVAGHSSETRRIVEDADRISGHGSKVIAEAVAAMSGIADTVRSSSQVVAELGTRTDEISRMADVIREIADQTNLLALNAAIEAARAGEQGRGFAVVADEVRKLAERTTLSTREITRTLERITAGARHATDSMNRGVDQVSSGVELAGKAGACIAEMREGSTHVGQSVTGIADSMREQSAASEHIASTVEEIAHQAENNREQAQLSAAASRQMYEIARDTREMLHWFRL